MSAKKKRSQNPKKKRTDKPTPIRLQRFLAQAGHGSRRECEELIEEGRVTVDGQVVSKLGSRVDPNSGKVKVDGVKVVPSRMQYYMVHKPTGVLSTCRDPAGRLRVIDLIKTDQRVYNVGRLDKSSEGLILVTNDGELANRLTHPRYGVQKTYHVTVAGNPKWGDLQQLKRGIRLAEAVAQVADIKIRKRRRDSCDLVIVLEEGRNREIRRLLAHIGHKVTRLRRVAIGPLHLGNLKAGDFRKLEFEEVEALKQASSRVHGRKTRRSRPVETSQLGGSRKRKSVKKRDASSSAGKKTKTRRKKTSKQKSGKKKRSTKTAPRRGAGRLKKATKRTATSRKKSAGNTKQSGSQKKTARGSRKKTARGSQKKTARGSPKKTARTRKGSGSRFSSTSRGKGRQR